MRVALPVVFAVLAATTVNAALPADPVLRDVERAFQILRDDRPGAANRARGVLAQAATALDDLVDDRETAAVIVGGDDSAAWRGLPHERVFILLTLAALDVDAGRCDLALPTLKNALNHRDRGRLQQGAAGQANADDPAVVTVLTARCALKDGVGDVEAARAALVALPGGAAMLPLVMADAMTLRFTGQAPTVVATGTHGEGGQLSFRDDDAPAFSITIGRGGRAAKAKKASTKASPKAATTTHVLHDLRREAAVPGAMAAARRGEAARQKSTMSAQANQYASRGASAVQSGPGRNLLGAGLLLTAAAGMTATSAVVDARVDTRTATSMPARILLIP